METPPSSIVLNQFVGRLKPQTYLEIGLGTGANISSLRIPYRVGIEPKLNGTADCKLYAGESDGVFASEDFQNEGLFDMVFVDGDHEYGQVVRDIENGLKHLAADGVLLVHDVNPLDAPDIVSGTIPQHDWCGDVWKAVIHVRHILGLDYCVIEDYPGFMVIKNRKATWPGSKCDMDILHMTHIPPYPYKSLDINWIRERRELMNFCTVEKALDFARPAPSPELAVPARRAGGTNFTGERVVPGMMPDHVHVLQEHIARYNFALGFVKPADTVLDAACGTGYGTMILSWRAHSATGVDIGKDVINYARTTFRDAEAAGQKISFLVEDVQSADLRRHLFPYEVVVSFETIEHVCHERFFKYIKFHLHPAGTLIISSPINPDKKPQNSHHKFEWDAAEFKTEIGQRFGDVVYYRQDGINITKTDDLETGEKGYGIAVCKGPTA